MGGRIFVSYARNDLREPELKDFFDNLEVAVALELGTPETETELFRDAESVEHGDDWSERLTEALRTCPVMLAVGSPSYVNSDYCGREFGVFYDRLAAAKPRLTERDVAGATPRAIFPVLWRKSEVALPAAFSQFQYDNDRYPRAYQDRGLRQLFALARFKDERLEMLHELARVLATAVRAASLRPATHLQPLRLQRNHFRPAVDSGETSAPPSKSAGANLAHVLIVAGRRDEILPFRTLVTQYGTEPWLWTPYAPESDRPIVVELQKLIADNGLISELVREDELLARVRAAEERNEVVIVVADPWATKIERCAMSMKRLDDSYFVNCVLVVAWNGLDAETTSRDRELQAGLGDVFRRKLSPPPVGHVFRGVGSLLELRARLGKEITEARLRLIDSKEPQPARDPALAAQAERDGIDVATRAVLSLADQGLR